MVILQKEDYLTRSYEKSASELRSESRSPKSQCSNAKTINFFYLLMMQKNLRHFKFYKFSHFFIFSCGRTQFLYKDTFSSPDPVSETSEMSSLNEFILFQLYIAKLINLTLKQNHSVSQWLLIRQKSVTLKSHSFLYYLQIYYFFKTL